jgi:regulator of sirC expression with transglutaminase-like and TPR domain
MFLRPRLEPSYGTDDIEAMMIAHFGLLEDEQIPLDLAALALSELDHPGADLQTYSTLLQDISSRLKEAGTNASRPVDRAAVLAKVLHDELNFTGDIANYDAPLNGDLIRVLDRRLGLPVSLSILYVAAARRIGWSAVPLNTPGHVLVRLGEEDAVVIDPFNGGEIVKADQLLALLDRAAGAGSVVSAAQSGPMSNRDTLVRLLMNQATRAEGAKDSGRAMTLYQRMTLIAPDNPDGWWSLARLQLGAGMIDQARKSLSAMLEITRDADRRDLVTSILEQIAEQ